MGMVVRTNTMALNAYRQLGMNNNAVAKSLEKLSSGFRINRAADDAAGLAISEKMKAQIKGLETASSNAQDGISLLQTAEGNLAEVHNMLNRMVELSTKSANGTYTTTEREALQDEVDALLEEIDRISQSANFNGTRLLDGSMGLNTEALKIGASTSATDAGETVITTEVTVPNDHASAGTSQVNPVFSIDLAEYSATVAKNADAAKTCDATVGFSFGGKDVTFLGNDETALAAAGKTVTLAATAADTDLDVDSTNIGAAINGQFVKIGDTNDYYKITVTNSTATFEWAGTYDGTTTTKAADGAKVTADTWVPSGSMSIDLKGGANSAGATNVTNNAGRTDCAVTKIDDPVVGADNVRAGAGLKLTADMVSDGAQLKIGDTTFTFSATAAANSTAIGTPNNGADVTISIKGVKSEDLLAYVSEQMSNYTVKATHTAEDGTKTQANFAINRTTTDEIHIDEIATAPNYAGFTKTELESVFKKITKDANASTTVTLNNDKLLNGDTISVNGKSYEVKKGADANETLTALKTALESDGLTATINGNDITIFAAAKTDKAPLIAGSGLTLQIGDTADDFNKMTITVDDMSANGLGLKNLSIMSEPSASDAIDTIKDAINKVSSTRAGMGALQNRLEYTINNLDVAVENLSAANSRIRDTDMAKEMMNYTKMNVLVQSAQAMLAQANQQPQSVLQLLQ